MKCNTWRFAVVAVALVSCSMESQPSLAAPDYVFGRNNNTTFMTSYPKALQAFNHFTAPMSLFGVDDVESAVGVNPTLTFGGTGITATTQGVLAQSAPGFQIGNQALVELDAVAPGQVNTMFTLSQPVTAFGLYVIQGGDSASGNPTTFRLRDTSDNSFVDVPIQMGPGWGTFNTFFIGLYDTVPFDEVEIVEAGDLGDGMLYDNVVVGYIPEPASLALVMFGGVCVLNRRRQ